MQKKYNETRFLLANVPAASREYAHGEGSFVMQLFKDGREVGRREGRNTIVQTGMTFMARRVMGETNAKMQYIQLGKSGTAAASAQTNILSALAKTTLSGRQTVATTSMNGRTATLEHTWTAGEFSAAGLEEAGLFNALTTSSVLMLARFVYTLVNKSSSDTIKISWSIRAS